MGKKTAKAISRLQSDIQSLSEAVWAMREQVRVELAGESAADGSRKQRKRKLAELETLLGESGAQGQVSTFGVYEVPGSNGQVRRVHWQQEGADLDAIVPLDADAAAALLAAIGHKQRLGIVVALMRQPMSVNELVSALDLGTSGAAYHHLNVLLNAGLVMQQERGTFEMAPEQAGRVAGVFAAMAMEPTVEVADAEAEPETDQSAAEADQAKDR